MQNICGFYHERNSERATLKQYHLFPFSYNAGECDDDDYDEDDNLPDVSPPYLPPKKNDGRIYTLVLDLDETLIHFEEVF